MRDLAIQISGSQRPQMTRKRTLVKNAWKTASSPKSSDQNSVLRRCSNKIDLSHHLHRSKESGRSCSPQRKFQTLRRLCGHCCRSSLDVLCSFSFELLLDDFRTPLLAGVFMDQLESMLFIQVARRIEPLERPKTRPLETCRIDK